MWYHLECVGHTHTHVQDSQLKRNRLLVAYSKLDEATKKSNRDTAYESIRTICALGCEIIPPSAAGDEGTTIQQLAREFSHAHVRTRTFRGQTCYKVTSGKWYNVAMQCCKCQSRLSGVKCIM